MYNLYNLSAALLPAQGAYCVSTQPQGVGDKKGSGRAHRAVTAGERVDLRAHQLRVRLRQGPAAQQVRPRQGQQARGPCSSFAD